MNSRCKFWPKSDLVPAFSFLRGASSLVKGMMTSKVVRFRGTQVQGEWPERLQPPTVWEALAAAAGLSAIQLVENAIAKKLQQTIHHFASVPPLVIVARRHLSCQLLDFLN